jgi:hypothetical protein
MIPAKAEEAAFAIIEGSEAVWIGTFPNHLSFLSRPEM